MTDSDAGDEAGDPLADADPGETVTIEREFELSPWYQRAADDFVGRDRDVDSRLELVATEDIGEQGSETLRATYRAEVTKLGEQDGDGQDAGATGRASQWRLAAAWVGVAGIGGVLLSVVVGLDHLAVPLMLVGPALVLAVVIGYGIQGGVPGMAGRGGRR